MVSAYNESSVSTPGQTLFYYKVGAGRLPLIVFHGFGQTHSSFRSWVSPLSQKYTLILVDLYYHGKSTWTDTTHPLEKEVWKDTVRLILERENIDAFALAGYSLGGKFALATLESFPDAVKELWLIAPDGITRNFWYSLATGSTLFRKIFRNMIGDENTFRHLTRVARMLRLVDRRVLRFAENQMDTAGKRERVYNTWVVFRHLKFDMREITRILNQSRIPTIIIAGKYDRIVAPHKLRGPLNRLKNMNFLIVESGHNDLIPAAIPFLAE